MSCGETIPPPELHDSFPCSSHNVPAIGTLSGLIGSFSPNQCLRALLVTGTYTKQKKRTTMIQPYRMPRNTLRRMRRLQPRRLLESATVFLPHLAQKADPSGISVPQCEQYTECAPYNEMTLKPNLVPFGDPLFHHRISAHASRSFNSHFKCKSAPLLSSGSP